jgi:hypothetical protein
MVSALRGIGESVTNWLRLSRRCSIACSGDNLICFSGASQLVGGYGTYSTTFKKSFSRQAVDPFLADLPRWLPAGWCAAAAAYRKAPTKHISKRRPAFRQRRMRHEAKVVLPQPTNILSARFASTPVKSDRNHDACRARFLDDAWLSHYPPSDRNPEASSKTSAMRVRLNSVIHKSEALFRFWHAQSIKDRFARFQRQKPLDFAGTASIAVVVTSRLNRRGSDATSREERGLRWCRRCNTAALSKGDHLMMNKRTTKPSGIKAPGPARSGASNKRPKVRPLEDEATDTSRTVKSSTKVQTCLDLLGRKSGAALSELMAATSWQAHSVRGFLSGTVKKKLGHSILTSRDNDGGCRYRIDRVDRSR